MQLPSLREVEQEAYDNIFGTYGHIDIHRRTEIEIARLMGFERTRHDLLGTGTGETLSA